MTRETLNWAVVIKYWPVVLAVAGLLVMGAETRYQVQGLLERKESDRRQWELIRETGTAITAMQEWRRSTDSRLVGIEVDIRDLERGR